MTAGKYKYLFGPVPSRRLGLSLGVDIVPFKTCTQDCIYCELGRGSGTTVERKDYFPIDQIAAELRARFAEGIELDYVTITGSGEPTLHSRLGGLVDEIRKITDKPIALITNGTLLYDKAVRDGCAKVDVVLPSLDAGDEAVFRRINRPDEKISFDKLVDGLCAFREEYAGQIWLEVFLIDGINTSADQLAKMKTIIERAKPDRVQLNTAVRPTAEEGVFRLDKDKMAAIAEYFGDKAEVVADFSRLEGGSEHIARKDEILSLITRRPCSLEDVCSGLGLLPNEAMKYIDVLIEQGRAESVHQDGKLFFKGR